jgi:hypothetical protein
MIGAHKPPHDIGAHPAQSDHSKLHRVSPLGLKDISPPLRR